MSDNVVFLAFRNDHTETDVIEHLTCNNCHNKTYTVIYDRTSQFPKLLCAACNSEAGHFGWVDEKNI